MLNLATLRKRIEELEKFPATENAPVPVRERANFDLQALKELLALREKGEGNAGEI